MSTKDNLKGFTLHFLKLFIAIGFEVFATSFLKLSQGFSVVIPSTLSILGYICSFYFLSQALKVLPVSVAYTIWSGLGTLGIFLVGLAFFNEKLSSVQILGIVLVISGAILLHWGGEKAFS